MQYHTILLSAISILQWLPAGSGTISSLRGIYAVSDTVAWAGGTGGTVLVLNKGAWKTCAIPSDGMKLDFRSVWAWNGLLAVAMSSGPGNSSRLYGTEDGCQHWRLLSSNTDWEGFWDALLFVDRKRGYLLGDPVGGRFVLMTTSDGGLTWERDKSAALQAASEGEGAFAASNSSLAMTPDGDLFFGTGGKAGARIFRRHGGVWTSMPAPVGGRAASSGVFSIAFRDALHGIAVGGDFKHPEQGADAAILTTDGGTTWHPTPTRPYGYRSSVAWDSRRGVWITVGPSGSDVSHDDGTTWYPLDRGNWNALSLPWVCGPDGRLAKLSDGSN